jgi:hypothetical protein
MIGLLENSIEIAEVESSNFEEIEIEVEEAPESNEDSRKGIKF